MKLFVLIAVVLVLGFVGQVEGGFYQVDISNQANFAWGGPGVNPTYGNVPYFLPDAPTGMVTLGSIPFNIKSNAAGEQAWNAYYAAGDGPGQVVLTMDVNTYGATNVYTLINTWWGTAGLPLRS